jgi:hypothetical protein
MNRAKDAYPPVPAPTRPAYGSRMNLPETPLSIENGEPLFLTLHAAATRQTEPSFLRFFQLPRCGRLANAITSSIFYSRRVAFLDIPKNPLSLRAVLQSPNALH